MRFRLGQNVACITEAARETSDGRIVGVAHPLPREGGIYTIDGFATSPFSGKLCLILAEIPFWAGAPLAFDADFFKPLDDVSIGVLEGIRRAVSSGVPA